ncbi:MAG UNVERIFIED_CONTAM: hypothetical protein LVT10_15675 [Anaerolineae bacterium]
MGTYDDSFNIETDAGLYYGEAGGSVAEKIGDGVSAIEIWMFDKDEFVNTPTAVIASPHLFTNPVARNKLQAKGNIVLAQVGQEGHLRDKSPVPRSTHCVAWIMIPRPPSQQCLHQHDN